MLTQGMNYLLNIKQDLLLTPDGGTTASHQPSIFPYFHFTPLYFIVFFLCLGFCFISLLYLNPMGLVFAFILLLFQSIAADCLLFSHNKSFLLCKERL